MGKPSDLRGCTAVPLNWFNKSILSILKHIDPWHSMTLYPRPWTLDAGVVSAWPKTCCDSRNGLFSWMMGSWIKKKNLKPESDSEKAMFGTWNFLEGKKQMFSLQFVPQETSPKLSRKPIAPVGSHSVWTNSSRATASLCSIMASWILDLSASNTRFHPMMRQLVCQDIYDIYDISPLEEILKYRCQQIQKPGIHGLTAVRHRFMWCSQPDLDPLDECWLLIPLEKPDSRVLLTVDTCWYHCPIGHSHKNSVRWSTESHCHKGHKCHKMITLHQYPSISDTLWLFNIAMENCPFIDGLPKKKCDFPWLC
jgi:hypothetical protein